MSSTESGSAKLVMAGLPDAAAVHSRHTGENFPVALRLLPERTRRHLLAIYGFARLVDDTGDEAAGNRSALLDSIDRDLDRIFAGVEPQHSLLRDLVPTVAALSLPETPLRRLIEANRVDQHVAHWQTFEELRAYCRLSAEPIGWLVLAVFGATTPRQIAWSDQICTGLQLVEHWQDVAEDCSRGRVYLPAEDLERFGCCAADLREPHARPALRVLLRFECERAREWLLRGEPLLASLRGHARLAVTGFAAGGHAALDAIAARDYDVLPGAPRPHRNRLLRHGAALWWRAMRS